MSVLENPGIPREGGSGMIRAEACVDDLGVTGTPIRLRRCKKTTLKNNKHLLRSGGGMSPESFLSKCYIKGVLLRELFP